MLREFTCIVCPNGCLVSAEVNESNEVSNVKGNLCKRGEDYVKQEIINPKRNIATSVLVENGVLPLASVRLTEAVPKKHIFELMEMINEKTLVAPVAIGDVVIGDVFGLGVDVVVTKDVMAQ